MIKTKKLKVTLLMGVIACFVAVFCCMQSAFANDVNSDDTSLNCSANFSVISESEKPIIGYVRGAYDGFFFKDEKEFEAACFGCGDKDYLKNEQELTIYVHENFNFNKFTCEIRDNRTFKFIIDEDKWLFSTDAHTMINVYSGNLILKSTSGYAYFSEPGEDTAIIVGHDGRVQAEHIWFDRPYEGKTGPSKGGILNLKDSKISNCHSDSEGGAIEADNFDQDYNLDNSIIDGCTAGNDGGAFFIYGNRVHITGTIGDKKLNSASELNNTSTIENCKSADCGGAIYVTSAPDHGFSFHVTNINFLHNTSKDDGGAIQTMSIWNQIQNCAFVDNYAKGTGGALDCYALATWGLSDEPEVKNCEFCNNTCGDLGYQVALSYIRTDNISGNRIYYKGDNFDPVKNIYTNHYRDCTWSDCFKTISLASTYKLHGTCGFTDLIGKGCDIRPVVNLNVELLDENNNVIDTTKTDGNGHYEFKLKVGSKVKVRACLPDSSNPDISNLISMDTDYEKDFVHREL